MCKEDLKTALSSTNRDNTVPLICWEDALQRSKTISLKEEDNDKEVIFETKLISSKRDFSKRDFILPQLNNSIKNIIYLW